MLVEFSLWGADYCPKSATGQLPKLPICVYRNTPQFADFPNSATGQLPKLPTCALPELSLPQFADFTKSATGQIAYICLQKFLPGVQIFPNLPLDSYLSYLHVLAEIPHQFADFLKSATGHIAYMCLYKFPPVGCRFSQVCHWTVT